MKTALLVIDMQNDFILDNAPIEVKEIKNHLDKFKNFIDLCRENDVEIIYTRHVFDPLKNLIESKLFPEMNDIGLRIGTNGFEIHESLKPGKTDFVIDKTRYDAFFKTKLDELFSEKGITNLIITGTMTNICCESTARSAMMRDFEVIFCSDLTFTNNFLVHNATLMNMSTHFGKVLTSEEILTLNFKNRNIYN